MAWLNRMAGIGSDIPIAASRVGIAAALMLAAAGTWWLVPLAKRGWTPTGPAPHPSEVWRASPNGTAQRVPGNDGTANNASGSAPSAAAPAPVPQLTGTQKFNLWAQAINSLMQEVAPAAPAAGGYGGSSVDQSRPAPPQAPAVADRRHPESFAPRGGYSRRSDNSRAQAPNSGRVPAPRQMPGGSYGGYRGNYGGFRGGFGGGGFHGGFSGGGGRRH